MNASSRDPFLDFDLDGLHLIEASAGTGKTFTLVTLVTRLLIERSLRVNEILAVTFTEAAAQDLREKLRRRIALAARIAAALAGPDAPGPDAGDAAYEVTRCMIEAQAQHEDIAAVRARLRRAEREIDLAAVFTIHGWCARVLSEHALETGQSFIAPEMIGSDRALRDDIAIDLWRSIGTDPLDAELLRAQWPDPQALATDLDPLLRAPRLLPPMPNETPDPVSEVRLAANALRLAFSTHGDDARAKLDAAIAGKALNGNSYKPSLPSELWHALQAWSVQQDATRFPDSRIERLAPHFLAAKTNKDKTTPRSPLFDAVAQYVVACNAREAWLAERRIAMVHRMRDAAAAQLAKHKREQRMQTFDDLIDDVAAALDGPHGEALAASLRAQHAVALVDEFQDTDARQWAIFQRVFGARALVLIGDPKQAIYRFRGGDVHAYLAAATEAAAAPKLEHNFRSRPALLQAIQALYRNAGEHAFVDPRIRFHPVQTGGSVADADFLRDGHNAAALTVRMLPSSETGKPWSAPLSRTHAATACVTAIHALLHDARAGRASIRNKPVQPGDIAVLVRFHHEATRMRAALIAAGIPAVAAGKQNLFDTEQAQELVTLFEALLHPGDESRLRAALSTVLLGLGGEAIARLDAHEVDHDGDDHDETGRGSDAQREWQVRAQAWRARWERHGPLALISDLCAQQAPRLLGLDDGERRLTNLLQLGEALQEADALALGLRGTVDWLRTCIAEADENDETQQLRLESDARCVQILTLHKSKGLEFPLVFLPFAGIGSDRKPGRHCEYPDDDGRVLQLKPAIDSKDNPAWIDAVAKWQVEERAEDARLLYVGLTRAQHALWLACGPLYLADATPLDAMLADIDALRATGQVVIDDALLPTVGLVPLPPESIAAPPPARIARRVLRRDWWVYSFSLLKREQAGADDASDERGAEDETSISLAPTDVRFTGTRFGNAMHLALEGVDFARWRDWRADAPPPGEEGALLAALRREGYADHDLDGGVPLLARLIRNTLNARMPEGARLCELPIHARRAEMEFHFAMGPVEVDEFIALLHAHGLSLARHGFGLRRRIEGLMTGKIDLVYAHDGRFHVLDYKSTRLADYDVNALAEAMRDSEYDLQYLIYTLALHRWLRFRMGDAYDYDAHIGGVRYLFCRGLDAQGDSGAGIYATRPPRGLIDALDALFAGDARSAA